MNDFQDKTAIVTGGGAGMGKAICQELARLGSIVYVADIDENNAKQVAISIEQAEGRSHYKVVDVSKEEDIDSLIDEVVAKYGHLDYIFNNAGIAIGGDLRDVTLDQYRKVLNVNLFGALYGTFYAYQVMAKQGFGHIVNTASVAGLFPRPGNIPYCISKYGVVGLTLSLRYEGADLGVKTTVVCPGRVKTDIFKSTKYINVSDEYLSEMSSKAMGVSQAVQIILNGVARNKEVIIFPFGMRVVWYLYRLFPWVVRPILLKGMRKLRKYRELN